MKTADDIAAEINTTIRRRDPERRMYWGLRADCGIDYEVGDIAAPSRVWSDGEPTDHTLDGTSAVAVDSLAARAARSVRDEYLPSIMSSVDGSPVIVLLCAEWARAGEDPGEIVMRDAEVVQVWR